jgi:hypothetical protein
VGLAVVTFVFWALGTAYVLLWADPGALLSSCSVGQHGVVQSCTSVDGVGVLLPWAIGFLGIVGGFLVIGHRRRITAN